MFTWIAALARNLRQSREGAVAIQMALIFAVLLGMAGLSAEIGFVIYKHRQMQSAADAAALGAATAIATGHPVNFSVEADALAAQVGFANGANGVIITVNNPPTSGIYAGNTSAVQVLITQPQNLTLVGYFGSGAFNLGVQSVALLNGLGSYCVLGLDPAASGAVFLSNNASLNVPNCGVGSNSDSNSGISLNNNASITGDVSVVGKSPGASLANNATITGTLKTGAPALQDPYSTDVLTPAGAPARTSPASCSPSCPLQPGEYSTGWNYSNNATLNLAAGVYYIDAKLSLTNNVTVNANAGVTIVIDGNYAMSLGNNVTINITAPTNGPTAGLAIAGIRTNTKTQTFSNNTTLNLKGAIYFPNGTVQFSNNAIINAPICGQLIADIIQIYNNGSLNSNCVGTGVLPITGGGTAQLVQ